MNMQRAFAVLILLTVIGGISVAKQTEKETELSWLRSKQSSLKQYDEDFASFAKAQSGNVESLISNDLATVARINSERIDATATLLSIYENMTCEKDRSFVGERLFLQFQYDIAFIDLDIDMVNGTTSFTKLPGVSQTALKMRDDLRAVKEECEHLSKKLVEVREINKSIQ